MTAELTWHDIRDAEILVERTGRAYFTRDDLAELLSIRPRSIQRAVAEGSLPRPAYMEPLPYEEGRVRAIWTCAQAAEALALRRRIPECGTDAGYRRHKKLNEAVDDACREAHRVKAAEAKARTKSRKIAREMASA